jgi:2-(1,2-epoxy-1,2-dihydrophenyl)acetyl-CoA isomerase
MTHEHFLYDVRGHVAHITIHRPAAFNTLNLVSMQQFLDIVTRCGSDTQVRAVVLTGAGDKAFCAGGDVAEFAQDPSTVGRLVGEMTTALHTAISRLAWMDAPVIAAVNGVAAGAGLALVAACDLAIAAEHASFSSAYTQIGLSPDGSSTYFLPRLIGRRRAMQMFLSNRKLSAAQALDWGLVNQVVPAADLQTTVDKLAAQLAQGPKSCARGREAADDDVAAREP